MSPTSFLCVFVCLWLMFVSNLADFDKLYFLLGSQCFCHIGANPSQRSDSCKLSQHLYIRHDWITLLETPRLIINLTPCNTAGLLCSFTAVQNNGVWTSSSLFSQCDSHSYTHSFPCVGQEWEWMVELVWCKSSTLPFVSPLPHVLLCTPKVEEF